MKTLLTTVCALAMLVAPAFNASAQDGPSENLDKGPDLNKYDFAIGDLTYKILDASAKTVEVGTLPNPKNPDDIPLISGHVTIPATVTHDGVTYKVQQVRYFGFKNSFNMTGLTIEEGVEYIDTAAFWGCHIKELNLPSSLKTIGFMGFFANHHLTDLTLPEGVEQLDPYAFDQCDSLMNVNLPQSLTRIKFGSFKHCSLLKEIKMPENLVELGGACFMNCISLERFDFPDGLETVNGEMFMGCSSLVEVNIPESVTGFNGYAFKDCCLLEKINMPSRLAAIWRGVFQGCTSLSEVKLPETVWILSMDAFKDCTHLESINIPVRVMDLGVNVLNGCTGLKYLYLDMPDAVIPSIEKYYSDLECLTFGPNVKTISIEKQVDGPWYYMNHKIVAMPTTPPTTTETVFETWDYDICDLLVPPASLDLYKAAEPWKNFLKMSGVDDISVAPEAQDVRTYDLQGRPADKGLLITSDGRKVIR